MKVFILGGTGFVGSAFCRRLALDPETTFVPINRENYVQYKGESCDLLVNANGNSSKILASRDPMADFDSSVRSVRASLEDFKYRRYIFLSSCDVYPDCSSPATTAEDQSIDLVRQSPYGFHKYLAELAVRKVAPDWLIFRMGGFVGPGLKKNAIYDILNGPKLWLHPDSELQFLLSDDLADIVLRLAASDTANTVLNVCGDGALPLRDAVSWAGHPVDVAADAKVVKYEIAIDRLAKLVDIPSTAATVRSFIQASIGARNGH
jgi:nucleoside-diphosphate-sugar epimerase